MFSRMRSPRKTRTRGRGHIEQDMQSKAVTIVTNSRQEAVADQNYSDGQSESPESNHSSGLAASPTSSSTSAKENSAPQKRGRGPRNLMMTYSPKRRKRTSSCSTINSATTPVKQNKRGRPPSSASSVVSKTSLSEKCGVNEEDGDDDKSTVSSSGRWSTTSSARQRASRASTRHVQRSIEEDKGGEEEAVEKPTPFPMPQQSPALDQYAQGGTSNKDDEEEEAGGTNDNEKLPAAVMLISDDEVATAAKYPAQLSFGKEDSRKRNVSESNKDGSECERDGGDSSDEENAAEGVYIVERIDDKRVLEGITYYFIKWKGWQESSNTWEPLENLSGCSDLLDDYERRCGVKKARRASRAKGKGGMRMANGEDEEEDEFKRSMREAQAHMRSYGVHPEWPADKEPISVHGVLHVDQMLTYIVRRKTRWASSSLDRSNAVLVYADAFRNLYPQLVIKFYERRVVWAKKNRCRKEQASIASQMAFLLESDESLLGTPEGIDSNVKGEQERDTKMWGVDGDALKTQAIGIEEEERIIDDSAHPDKETCVLAENMDDSTSVSSVSDSEMENDAK